MELLLLLGNSLCYAGQSVTGKLCAKKGGDPHSFNLFKAMAALAFFSLWLLLRAQGLHGATAPFALAYGICLSISMYAGFQALACGPMALTGMLAAMSLIIPFLWGILFWREPLTATGIAGLCLLLGAIGMISFRKGGKISGRWLIYCAITLVFNGFCSVIQKYHQIAFPGGFQVDFMFFAMAAVTAVLLALQLLRRYSPPRLSLLGCCSGIFNGLANYLVLLLSASQAATTLYPVVGAGNVMAAYVCGILFFREHIRLQQLIGLLLGICGIVLMQR